MKLPPPMQTGGGGVSLELLALLSALGAAALSALAVARRPPDSEPITSSQNETADEQADDAPP